MKHMARLLAAGGIVLLVALMWPRYFVRWDLNPYVTTLSKSNEVFIFIGRTTTGQSGGTARLLWKSLSIFPQLDHTREDLIVAHLVDGKLITADLRGFSPSGSTFPFQGALYFMRGTVPSDWPQLWKWNGTNFGRMEKADALKILNSFTYTSALIKAEGWKEESFRFRTGEFTTNFPLNLGMCLLTLREETVGGATTKTAEIEGRSNSLGKAKLAQVLVESKAVKRANYQAEFNVK